MSDYGGIAFEIYDPAEERHVGLADSLERMRADEQPVMLPISSEILSRHTVGVIASLGGVAVGYNGIIFEYEDGIIEMGGLFINPDFRGRGLVRPMKAKLFEAVRGLDRVKSVITFANANSLHLNLDYGFRRAERHEIPNGSIANCSGCPKQADAQACGMLCCDTILVQAAEDLPHLWLSGNSSSETI